MTVLRTGSLLFVFGSIALVSAACSDGASTPATNDSGAVSDAQTAADSSTASDGSLPIDAKPIDVTFAASCPGATPCGGSVVGTWDYTAVCVDEPLAQFKKNCPSATVTNQKGTVKGRVTFDATTVKRTSSVTYSATIDVPAECSAGQCAAVQNALKSAGTVTCKAAGGGCSCDLTVTDDASETNAYTIQGNQVKIADGAIYDYCVSGAKLAYVPSGSTKERAGAYEMTKK